MAHRHSRDMILWFFLALFIASIFMLAWLIWPFISVIILASVVTGIFNPVYRFFKEKINPSLASLITCILIFFILFVPIVLFVGILTNEAADLYQMGKNAVIGDQLKSLLESSRASKVFVKASQVLANFNIELSSEEIFKATSDLGKTLGFYLLEQSRAVASNVLKFLGYFFFMLLIIYYLLIDGHKLISFLIDLSPLPREQDEKLIQKFRDMAGAVLLGNGLGGLIQGILGGLVFALFGLKSPFLWGVIMALLAFLPIVGIGAVFIPAAIYLFVKGRIAAGVFFVIFYLALSGGIEYLFKPRLVGQRVRMHTLLVFLSIIGGLNLFGILGIIYGPLVVTAFLTLTDIYHASYQRLVDPNGLTTDHS